MYCKIPKKKIVTQDLSFLLRAAGVKRFVIWGLKKPNHSHFFIHSGFYTTLKKLDISVVWFENTIANNVNLIKDDFIITADVSISNLQITDAFNYCFHNVPSSLTENLSTNKYIKLQVLTNDAYSRFGDFYNREFNLEGASYFTKHDSTLYQSWGTPSIASEFSTPKYVSYKKHEFFIGSIWNNQLNQGNMDAIQLYEGLLKDFRIKFIQTRGCSEFFNRIYIRNSAIATSVVGDWQRINGYTPCRVFKSIAYGRLGIINSHSSVNQYPWLVGNESINELLENVLSMSESMYLNLVRLQQDFLVKETYQCKLSNMLKALIYVKDNN